MLPGQNQEVMHGGNQQAFSLFKRPTRNFSFTSTTRLNYLQTNRKRWGTQLNADPVRLHKNTVCAQTEHFSKAGRNPKLMTNIALQPAG